MVSSSRIDGGAQVLPAGVRRTIQSIKEVVRNHSDADIYVALRENNMDPNETIHRLINQDPFHEVKRRRERRKENKEHKSLAASEPRKNIETVPVPLNYKAYVDRNARRGGAGQNVASGASVEFRVVRDNRIGQNASGAPKPAQSSTSTSKGVDESLKSGSSGNQEPREEQHSPKALNCSTETQPRKIKNPTSDGEETKQMLGEKQLPVFNALAQVQTKENESQPHSPDSPRSLLMGVYSSSYDPVHVPSLNSKLPSNIGAIRRDVGVVGPRRLLSNNSTKHYAQAAQDSHSTDSSRPLTGGSKSDKSSQNVLPEPIANLTAARSVVSTQHGSRSHQIMGHQKALLPNKEWKPKLSAKPSPRSPGTPTKVVSPEADNAENLKREPVSMQDKLSKLSLSENQNVIIASHIRVSELDRCRLTFGSLGSDLGSSINSIFTASEVSEELSTESSGSVPVSPPEASENDPSLKTTNVSVLSSGSNSPASDVESGKLLSEKKESSSPKHLEYHVDVGLVQDNSPFSSESLQRKEDSELPSFSGYDPKMDMSYFHPVHETARGPVFPSPQEVLNIQMANSNPASTISMVQQQQQHMAQMYSQMHVSAFANLLPYRQFVSPVYVPGYSNSAAYPHPSNGSSYLLMPGNNSHVTQSGVKYGMQQFKHVPTGIASGFGNFMSQAGYAISAPGIATEDSSMLNYKDGLYVPNPQAETSEIWMNPRDLSGLQSASYYSIAGQTPQAAYLTSQSGQVSFNPAAPSHSPHRQFPGTYHPPPQPLGPTMGGNVGVGMAASAAQVSAYQQQQMGQQINWAPNF